MQNDPVLHGREHFRGSITHTAAYREPTDFKDKTVLVIGVGPSGVDIGSEIADVARRVVVSSRKSHIPTQVGPQGGTAACSQEEVDALLATDARVITVGGILHISEEGKVVLVGCDSDPSVPGAAVAVDAIVCATGYQYSFPFLSDDLITVTDSGKQMQPLYRQLVHAHYPSLYFVGIMRRVLPFPLFEDQALYVADTLTGHAPPMPDRAQVGGTEIKITL